MVLVKHENTGDSEEFLFATPAATSIDELVEKLVQIWNGRLRLRRMCECASVLMGSHTGSASHTGAEAVRTCVSGAEEAISAARSRDAVPLTPEVVEELAAALNSAVEVAFEKGVPDKAKWAEATKQVASSGPGAGIWMPGTAELWMAKRMFERGTRLSQRIGHNEKTRITVRLVRPVDAAAPSGKRKGTAASKKADAAVAAAAAAVAADGDASSSSALSAAAVMESNMLQKYVREQFGSSQPIKRQRVLGRSDPDPDDEENGRLTLKVQHFSMVRDSEKARWYLRDEKLQEVIRQIDAHESDKDREAALQERLEKDESFAAAVDELLVSMGFARRDGTTGSIESTTN